MFFVYYEFNWIWMGSSYTDTVFHLKQFVILYMNKYNLDVLVHISRSFRNSANNFEKLLFTHQPHSLKVKWFN